MNSHPAEHIDSFRRSIAVVTYPFSDPVGSAALENLLSILSPSCDQLVAVTGNMPKSNSTTSITHLAPTRLKSSPLGLLASRAYDSIRLAITVATLERNVVAVIFFMGARVHPLAVAAARVTGRRTLVASTGSAAYTTAALYGASFGSFWGKSISAMAGVLERLSFLLANIIGVESQSVVSFARLDSMKPKIQVTSEYYVDDASFYLRTLPSHRPLRIGYIGRLSPEKGVLNLLDSLSLLLPKVPDYEFVLGGSGPLFDIASERAGTLGPRLKVLGWLPRAKVVSELAQMRLIIMPSFTEGLPSMAIEAMATGTPILATAVGGIPDIITDQETGFILRDNRPETIASQAVRAIVSGKLDRVALAANQLAGERFSFTTVSRQWKECLTKLCR